MTACFVATGVLTQQPAISTGGSQPVLGGSDIAAMIPADQGSASGNTASGAAEAPAQRPGPTVTPKPRHDPTFVVAPTWDLILPSPLLLLISLTPQHCDVAQVEPFLVPQSLLMLCCAADLRRQNPRRAGHPQPRPSPRPRSRAQHHPRGVQC